MPGIVPPWSLDLALSPGFLPKGPEQGRLVLRGCAGGQSAPPGPVPCRSQAPVWREVPLPVPSLQGDVFGHICGEAPRCL